MVEERFIRRGLAFPLIAGLVDRRFPNASEEDREIAAEAIHLVWKMALEMEDANRSGRPMEKDQEDLRKTAKHLRNAEKCIARVKGKGSLAVVLANDHYVLRHLGWLPSSRFSISDSIRSDVAVQAGALESALEYIVQNDSSALDQVFVDEPSSNGGRPPEIVARWVTKIAASVFEKLSGKRATMTTYHFEEPESAAPRTKPRGPFFDFLKELFSVLRIEASAESQISARRSTEKTPPDE